MPGANNADGACWKPHVPLTGKSPREPRTHSGSGMSCSDNLEEEEDTKPGRQAAAPPKMAPPEERGIQTSYATVHRLLPACPPT